MQKDGIVAERSPSRGSRRIGQAPVEGAQRRGISHDDRWHLREIAQVGTQGQFKTLKQVPLAPPLAASANTHPHSVAAEQALLGALLINNRLIDDVERLRPEHFYVPLHAAVFEAIDHLINQRGVEASPISVDERLKNTAFDAKRDLFPHLASMFENASLASDVKALGEVVLNTYAQRQVMGLADGMRREAGGASTPERMNEILQQASDELYRLGETGKRNTRRSMRDSLRAMLDHAEHAKRMGGGLTGVTTGLVDVDQLLGGLQNSDLIILGGRPSMGKTGLLLNLAFNAAAAALKGLSGGTPVGFFSLEMSAEQLVQRMSASVAGINAQRIANGHLNDADFSRLAETAGGLSDLPLHIDDGAALSIQEIRARARQMKREHGIGLLCVDYLQLITAPGRRNDMNRVQEVSDISQGLKQIARELDIPVVAASQLSRNVESRDNKRPLLADLRDSGSIEQDADVVGFLYRDEYYTARQVGGATEETAGNDADRRRIMDLKDRLEKSKGLAELIIAKNRKGPTDTINLLFRAETTTFQSRRHQPY